jgi:hypothetical protein
MYKKIVMILVCAMVPLMGLQAKSVEQKLNSGELKEKFSMRYAEHAKRLPKINELGEFARTYKTAYAIYNKVYDGYLANPNYKFYKNEAVTAQEIPANIVKDIFQDVKKFYTLYLMIDEAFVKTTNAYTEFINGIDSRADLTKLLAMRDEINRNEDMYMKALGEIYTAKDGKMNLLDKVKLTLPRRIDEPNGNANLIFWYF